MKDLIRKLYHLYDGDYLLISTEFFKVYIINDSNSSYLREELGSLALKDRCELRLFNISNKY